MKGRSNRLQRHLLGREQSLLLVGNSAASSSSACCTISCSAAEQSRNIMATPCCSPENGQGQWMTASRSLSSSATNTGRGLLSRSRPALVNPYHGDKPEWMTDVSHPITMVSPKFLRMWHPKSLLRGNLFRRPLPDLLDSRYAKRTLMVKASPGRLLKRVLDAC
ncbi:unnamed protein product [Amoebophrya sp. A25]|nr:unnamed protein product [Amoebophrya sp. A25]|eukprot:GSA25T00009564001.1